MLALYPSGGLGGAPLISFGGKTTPGGALISSSTAIASPFVADGTMSTESPVFVDLGFVEEAGMVPVVYHKDGVRELRKVMDPLHQSAKTEPL